MSPEPSRHERRRALAGMLAIGAAAALWAIAAAVASELFRAGVGPIALAEARAVITAAGMLVLSVARPSLAARRGHGGLHPIWFVALGASIALVNVAYYVAIERLAVAVAIVLQYTAPALVVAFAAIRLRRVPGLRLNLALAGALLGVVLVSELPGGDVGELDPLGLAAGFASAILFAAYTLLSEKAGNVYLPAGVMVRAFGVAAVGWLLFQIPQGLPHELWNDGNLPRVLFVGLAGTLAPFLLYVWGVRRVQAERATIAATSEPVLAALFAWALLDQSLSPMQLTGGALVIAAVAFLQTSGARATKETGGTREPVLRES